MHREFLINELPKNSIGAEIGVWKGEFAKHLNENVKPKTFYLVDPWEFMSKHPDRWYGGSAAKNQNDMDDIYQNVISMFENDSNVKILKTYSDNLPEHVGDGELDWIYIDGNHSYEFVLRDLYLSYKLVKEGGLITGDDFANNNDIDRALKTFLNDMGDKVSLQTIKNRQFIVKIDKK
jgi:hypothetical protein